MGWDLEKTSRYSSEGRSIYTEDWDVLLILDACRVDQLEDVASEYSYLPDDVPEFHSLAGYSREWLCRNFTDKNQNKYFEEISNTAYISGNPFTADVFSDDHPFGYLDEVWKYSWDDENGTIHPDALTDRAIQLWREGNYDRMIVHYMQPHIPFVGGNENWHEGFDPHSGDWGTKDQPKDLWARYRDGEITASREELWKAYQDNLRYVLDHLDDVLLKNISADSVVISADHGNAVGEGWYYGHGDVPLDVVQKVPWVTVSAKDSNQYTPEIQTDNQTDSNVEERLRLSATTTSLFYTFHIPDKLASDQLQPLVVIQTLIHLCQVHQRGTLGPSP